MEAISFNPHMSASEKHILHEIAAMMNAYGKFTDETRWIRLSDLAERTSLSVRTVQRATKSLQNRGYLVKQARRTTGSKEALPSRFGLTNKVFDDYTDLKRQEAQVQPLFPLD